MEEIELINNDSLEKVYFNQSNFYSADTSLSMLLKNYYDSDSIEDQDEILEKIIKTHQICYGQFHEMIGVFKRRLLNWGNKYWVLPLKKEVIRKKIELGKEEHSDVKCRFFQFTFNGKNNAKFSYKPVKDFGFKSGLSCYIEILLEYILETYDEIYVVKGRNHLSNIEVRGKTYDGKYNIAMLKCKLKHPIGPSEKESFHYFDVVHDPGGGNI